MVPTALSPGSFVLLLLSVVIVLVTVLTAFIIKLALTCSPVCNDTDDEALECDPHSLDGNVAERKPNSRRSNANDTRLIETMATFIRSVHVSKGAQFVLEVFTGRLLKSL
ncbi:hypothetical protein QTP88_011042 [Uroleucon formosanum]